MNTVLESGYLVAQAALRKRHDENRRLDREVIAENWHDVLMIELRLNLYFPSEPLLLRFADVSPRKLLLGHHRIVFYSNGPIHGAKTAGVDLLAFLVTGH